MLQGRQCHLCPSVHHGIPPDPCISNRAPPSLASCWAPRTLGLMALYSWVHIWKMFSRTYLWKLFQKGLKWKNYTCTTQFVNKSWPIMKAAHALGQKLKMPKLKVTHRVCWCRPKRHRPINPSCATQLIRPRPLYLSFSCGSTALWKCSWNKNFVAAIHLTLVPSF